MNFDYSNKNAGNNFEVIKTKDTKSVSKKISEPKISEFFQESLANTQTQASKTLINTHVEQYAKDIENHLPSLEFKANSIGITHLKDQNNIVNKSNIHHQLIDEDIKRMNSINNIVNNSKTNSSKFASMTDDELDEKLDNPETTDEEREMIANELEKRMDQLEELESQKNQEISKINEEELKINEEKFQETEQKSQETEQKSQETEQKSQETEQKSQETEQKLEEINITQTEKIELEQDSDELKNNEFLVVDKNGNTRPATLVDLENKKIDFILLNSKTGVAKIPQNLAKHFKEGQIIKDKDGKEVKITKIDILSKERIEQYRQAFILYNNNLNPPVKEEKKEQTNLDEIDLKKQLKKEHTQKQETTIAVKKVRPEYHDINLNLKTKSTKEINEKRIIEGEKEKDLLDDIIKKILKVHEILVEEIKHTNISFDIETFNRKTNKLNAECLETKNLIDKTIKEKHYNIETKLPEKVFQKVETYEKHSKEIIKMIPKKFLENNKELYEAVKEILSIENKSISFIKETPSSNNGIDAKNIGNATKSTSSSA